MPSGVYVRTEEYKANQSVTTKKLWQNTEYRENHVSPEVRAKKSASEKIAQNRPEVKAKKSIAVKKLHADPNSVYNTVEYKEKQSNVQKIAQNRPEVKAKKSAATKKNWQSPDFREKQFTSVEKLHTDPEYMKNQYVAAKKRWANPVYREKQLKAIFKGLNLRPNKPESLIIKLLQEWLPNEYKYTGDGSVWIGYKNPDFVNINGQKKIIEYFGAYPHGPKRTGRINKEEENQRINHFAKYGYQTLIIWEHELEDVEELKKRILLFNQI